MILKTVIILICSIIIFWLSGMYIWWQKEKNKSSQKIITILYNQTKYIERFGRKNFYALMFYTKKVLYWGNKKITKTIIKVFPKTKNFIEKPEVVNKNPSSHLLFIRQKEENLD